MFNDTDKKSEFNILKTIRSFYRLLTTLVKYVINMCDFINKQESTSFSNGYLYYS